MENNKSTFDLSIEVDNLMNQETSMASIDGDLVDGIQLTHDGHSVLTANKTHNADLYSKVLKFVKKQLQKEIKERRKTVKQTYNSWNEAK